MFTGIGADLEVNIFTRTVLPSIVAGIGVVVGDAFATVVVVFAFYGAGDQVN